MIRRYEQFSTAIARIYHQIQKVERDEMEKYGLKGPHAQCLVVMCRFRDGITVSDLCDACEKDKAAVSRAVAELEKKQLIIRDCCGRNNAYRAPLRLTEAGWSAARQIIKRAEEVVEYAGQDLSDKNRIIFYNALNAISDRLRTFPKEGNE